MMERFSVNKRLKLFLAALFNFLKKKRKLAIFSLTLVYWEFQEKFQFPIKFSIK